MSTKDIFSRNRNQFDIHKCIIYSDGIYTEIYAIANSIFLNIVNANLTCCGNWQLIGNNTLCRQICFSELSVFNKHITQRLLHSFYSDRTRSSGLHIERGHRIMKCFTVVWHNSTRLNIRLSTNAGFYNTSIKANTFIVDKETVCSATAGKAAVLIYGNKVMGA